MILGVRYCTALYRSDGQCFCRYSVHNYSHPPVDPPGMWGMYVLYMPHATCHIYTSPESDAGIILGYIKLIRFHLLKGSSENDVNGKFLPRTNNGVVSVRISTPVTRMCRLTKTQPVAEP
jgi:hypothetical protein